MARQFDPETLQAAILGYRQKLDLVNARILELRRKLAGHTLVAAPALTTAPRKHHVSAEGRARIAAAQRKRWAAVKKAGRSAA
jgi:hypothetical protein